MSITRVPSIAIVGSGIAGTTLAAILARQPKPPKIELFERDSQDRDQGTGFDVEHKGLEALKRAGVFPRYAEFSRAGSDIARFYVPERDSVKFILTAPKITSYFFKRSPESNRQQMRDALLASFGQADHVHFNCRVSGIRQKGKQAELLGVDGKVLGQYDLVVDSSGFSSALRSFRIDEPTDASRFDRSYTGLTMVHGLIPDPEATCDPRLVSKLGEGSLMSLSHGRFFFVQRYGAAKEDRRASMCYVVPIEHITGLANELGLPHSSRWITDDETMNRIKNWVYKDMKEIKYTPDFLSAVENSTTMALRPLLQHPGEVVFREDNDLPLILAGDSLHAMPPYSGSGGNFALADAMDLADFIQSHPTGDYPIPQLRELEKGMLQRTWPKMKGATRMRDQIIEADAKRRRGEPSAHFFGPPGTIYLAQLFTWLYRLEAFLGLHPDHVRH